MIKKLITTLYGLEWLVAGLLLIASTISARADVTVNVPMSEARMLLGALLTEQGMKIVNDSEDHPAFERFQAQMYDGRNVYDVIRYKLTQASDGSTIISARYEMWAEKKPGTYPNTEKLNVVQKDWVALQGREAEQLALFIIERQPDPEGIDQREPDAMVKM
jgi:hypothetical protein